MTYEEKDRQAKIHDGRQKMTHTHIDRNMQSDRQRYAEKQTETYKQRDTDRQRHRRKQTETHWQTTLLFGLCREGRHINIYVQYSTDKNVTLKPKVALIILLLTFAERRHLTEQRPKRGNYLPPTNCVISQLIGQLQRQMRSQFRYSPGQGIYYPL